jgi:hypothetical protein
MRCCEAANVVTRVTTSGNITDDVTLRYLANHIDIAGGVGRQG